MGRLLPERRNIIVTRDKSYKAEGAVIVSSIEEAMKECELEDEAFIIGGGEIAKLALPYAQKMYLTHVDTNLPADSFFPEFDESEWKVISEDARKKDDKHLYDFTFKVYEKLTK
ncbi:MAG: dihydrofolate reductase, partial [bacterium]|nr:dihydrofolate reductase [bacterium]